MLKDSRERFELDAVISLKALAYIAGNPEVFGRFLALTGLGPESLRKRLEEPAFQLAVLDFLMGDESLLLAFSADQELEPRMVAKAHARLGGFST